MSARPLAGILFSRHPAGCVGWKPTLLNAAKMEALVDSACNFVPRVMVV
jgi:hypothetical protein